MEYISDILAESDISSTVDFGSVIIHDVTHPEIGSITLINSACGRCAIVASV